MIIRFYAMFRQIAGSREIDYGGSAPNIRELLDELGRRYGEEFRRELEKGSAYGLIILVNGKHIAHLGGMDTALAPDDTVDIFPLAAGG